MDGAYQAGLRGLRGGGALIRFLEGRDQPARDLIELRLIGRRETVPDRNQAGKRPALDFER